MRWRVGLQFVAIVVIMLFVVQIVAASAFALIWRCPALVCALEGMRRAMVKLNKIYTRTGDAGTTGLGTGERVRKDALRIAAYGTVDETNAAIGLVRLHLGEPPGPRRQAGAHPERPLRSRRRPLRARPRREARVRAAARTRRPGDSGSRTRSTR